MEQQLSLAHWVYLISVVLIIAAVVGRKNVVIPAVVATIATSLAYTGGDILAALSAVFNASFVAATELFTIFLTIALVTALLGSLKNLGADLLMVRPFQPLMRGGTSAYVVLAVVTFTISLFFWPTPALPLLGAILVPAAIRAGLSPVGCAIAIALAGQGMALAADYVMGVAPQLSAEGAGVPAAMIADRALVLSVAVGLVALPMAYVLHVRKAISAPSPANLRAWMQRSEAAVEEQPVETPRSEALSQVVTVSESRRHDAQLEYAQHAGTDSADLTPATTNGRDGSANADAEATTLQDGAAHNGAAQNGAAIGTNGLGAAVQGPENPVGTTRTAKAFAIAVPVAFLILLVCMILGKTTDLLPGLEGSQGASLIGGTSVVLLALATIAHNHRSSLDMAADHIVDGLVFAFKAMGVVIPIAGFIFMGIPDFAGRILGLPEGATAPGFLFDLIRSVETYIPNSTIGVVFAMLLIGMIIGLDGNGWAGLPLTGTFANGLAEGGDSQIATLAAMAQVSATWTGGGTLLIWSSLVAVAGITRTSVVDLARMLFLPVIVGLATAGLVAVAMMQMWG
ncbi:MAG TPA: hypothetical protein VFJ14_14835 [Nocardioidaceae bacterium]|nr:hypothetical protein [Nocardioidaceae bacterium]